MENNNILNTEISQILEGGNKANPVPNILHKNTEFRKMEYWRS